MARITEWAEEFIKAAIGNPPSLTDGSAFADPLCRMALSVPPGRDRFHLQRFAAEDEGRTEDPTERRKREEREKGNVPKSQDVVSSLVLAGGAIVLLFTATFMYFRITELFRDFLGGRYMHLTDFGEGEAKIILLRLFIDTAFITGPILLITVVMGVIGNVSQVGVLFTLQPLAFKLERLIPDFKRVLPTRRTMYNLGRVIMQVIIIGIISYIFIMSDFVPMLRSGGMGLKTAIGLFAWTSAKMLLSCAIVLFLLAIPDYFYQRFEYIEKLKMTVSEAKRERKDEDGDPMIRQRQRERGMELRRRQNMLKEVPRADVVITNPTHYAVALQYDVNLNQAPAVTAKGADHLAFIIRTIARENNVPIKENPTLARLLYREVEIGQEIPEHLFHAVSIIFARLDRFQNATAGAEN